jgi:cell division protein FtsL
MAKNRKSQSAAIRFGPAVKALLLCLFIVGSGVGYVWQKSQIRQLARQIKEHELRLADLKGQNEKLKRYLAELRSPARLERRAADLNLGLAPPVAASKVQLVEPAAEPAPVARPVTGPAAVALNR